ncbi:helix-turn-helix transcriptional regulator [Phycicoccus sp. CSK15P-2]|uniref:helix-turn-helix transcriptional regulator n=1 Tax=Phycicoccus sp. CSK15P-2 TaxID=2807627 RepID=UPI00194F99B2|nr:helix-turn-helix transcriptional regulator [Phycicoccus sp. CSK15P-2]MBM6403592.1 helix-turn-helix transcriptional regulator [Phycicoccus sp. CSK15P-2]MBM6405057.1 helix-turn-helix transcriptional regulator [Phycicoccus sp. CSK15P-2]
MRTPSEPTSARAFFDHVHALMLADDPRLTLLGPLTSADEHLDRRYAQTRHSLWNQQVTVSVRSTTNGSRSFDRHHPGGLPEERGLVDARGLADNPLFPSLHPQDRIHFVSDPMLITDETHVLLAGPLGTRYADTIWESVHTDIVGPACHIFLAAWTVGRPITDVVDRPLLEPRPLQVALHLAGGATDREIATALGTSHRTVSTEVRHIIDWLGARNRAHAVAMLVGTEH